MTRPAIDIADLPPEIRKQLNLRAPRRRPAMDKNAVRTAALRILAVIADLTPAERARVLTHAGKLNAV